MQFIKLSAKGTVKRSGKKLLKSGGYESHTELERNCLQQGIRVTIIRQAILGTLDQASGYMTAEEIYCKANQINGVVSMSATYCTLKLLSDKGIIDRRKFQSKQNYYSKSALGRRDHLIDEKSGRVTEFHNKALDKLKEQIAREHGYNATDCQVEFYVRPRDASPSVGYPYHD